jgi:cysteine desulfurase
LREKIFSTILNNIDNVNINGSRKSRLVNNINISIAGAEGESLVLYLDHEGFAVSTGSACSASDLKPSGVLLALGLSEELAHCSLRISLGRYTSEEGVNRLLSVLPNVIEKVRKMSAIKK